MSESEILKLQQKILKLKKILEETKEVRERLDYLARDVGTSVLGWHGRNLEWFDTKIGDDLVSCRLRLAELRGE